MRLIHHVSENLILNQGYSQKYNYNENIHVDNNEIINPGNYAWSFHCSHINRDATLPVGVIGLS